MLKKSLKFVLYCLILGGIGYGIHWYRNRPRPVEPTYYRSQVIQRGSLTQEVTATGTIAPIKEVSVTTQVTGKIISLSADYNAFYPDSGLTYVCGYAARRRAAHSLAHPHFLTYPVNLEEYLCALAYERRTSDGAVYLAVLYPIALEYREVEFAREGIYRASAHLCGKQTVTHCRYQLFAVVIARCEECIRHSRCRCIPVALSAAAARQRMRHTPCAEHIKQIRLKYAVLDKQIALCRCALIVYIDSTPFAGHSSVIYGVYYVGGYLLSELAAEFGVALRYARRFE